MTNNTLNFISKLVQPSLRGKLEDYVKTRNTSNPIIIEFDPTTTCNFACPECIDHSLLNKGQIELTRTLALIDEFHRTGIKGVIFIGGGEPLTQKGMPAPIRHCYELGIKVGLTTNGSLIHRYIDTISQCVSWTRVSVDASNQETFSIFRPSNIANSFRKVTENIESLAKSKTGKLGFSFLMMERNNLNEVVTNTNEIFEAAYLAKELGCDYFQYKPMVDKNHNLIPLSLHIRKSLEEQIAKMQSLNTDSFQVISPDSMSHLLNETSEKQPKKYSTCPILEFRTVVTPKGIYPCPYKRGCEEMKLGEINVQFNEFWASKERRERTAKIDPSKDCPYYCIRHDVNVLLLSLAKAHDSGIDLLSDMVGNEIGDIFI